MSTLNWKVLHKPLPTLQASSLRRVFSWWLEGLARIAPRRLREWGWRSQYRVIGEGADGVVERSVFGESRLVPENREASALPVAVELPPARVFETSTTLPSAARDVRQAIRFRLDDLSPLPAAEVLFSVSETTRLDDGRISVDLAIARKADVDAILERYSDAAPAQIGARLLPDGRFAFTFYEGRRSGGRRRSIIAWSALFLGGVTLVVGVQAHLDRRIEAGSAYEARLLAAIRDERGLAARYADATEPVEPALDRSEVLNAIDALAKAAPERAVVERATIDASGVAITAVAPEAISPPIGAVRIERPGMRPGYASYALRLPPETAK